MWTCVTLDNGNARLRGQMENGGKVELVVTKQHRETKRGTRVPVIRCARCQKERPWIAFFTVCLHPMVPPRKAGDIGGLWRSGRVCVRCEQPPAFNPYFFGGKFRVQLDDILTEDGSVLEVYDESTGQIAPPRELRCMTDSTEKNLKLRMQPYRHR